MPDPAVPANRSVMIVLAYLWILALVPLFLDKHDAEVQWHAKNGIALAIAELALVIVYAIVTSVVSVATFSFGCVLGLLFVFAWVGIMAVHIMAIIKGVNGSRLIVPGVSQYADRF